MKLLDRDPRSVEEFVQHLTTLNKVNSDLGNIEIEFEIISKMFHIVKDFSMNVAPEAYALFRSLAPIYQQLRVGNTFYFSNEVFLSSSSQVYFIPKHNAMKMFRNLPLILMI